MDIGDFKDQYGPVALVAGASSGIGKAFAEVLAAMGLDLVLVARRLDRLEELAAKLSQEHGVQVRAVQIDLSAPTAPQQMLDATGALDVGLVVSNAGFGMKGAHADNDPQAMADMLMVNCHVPMQLAHGFIPRLRQRGRGGLIFTSSVEALMGCPYSAAYSASKALVKALGEGLWAELQPEGIDVLTLCPGATESEAAANQGIDMSTLPEVMSAEEVAQLTLENLSDGPVFISSDYYRSTFETLLSMPRRDALMAMAGQMKR
ncbi:SDR family NAD(P)-dependent oxidoreductase [Nocardia vinacea]|uniref:SDR family NAD(P)-dependent oxidoreductase n=1 Tax=Nocardia vinacea TaxID=96468 RepID=UPI0002D92DFD|nr:SDR family NAD(P)-dependent oxidoreductase [Nocardia vinacea]